MNNYKMLKFLFGGIWLIVALYFSYWGVVTGGESNIGSMIVVMILAFPISFVAYLVAGVISMALIKIDPSLDHAGVVLTYVLLIGAGYFQWFVFLPKAVTKFKREKTPLKWLIGSVVLSIFLVGSYLLYKHTFPQ